MTDAVVDFSGERLVRLAPERPIALEPADRDYILAALSALGAAFPGQVASPPPLGALPARAVMRLLVDLRRLRPVEPTAEQRTALGALAGAISLFHNACAFALARERAAGPRRD